MRIHVYTICWNEYQFLPYFLRHYEQFCEAIFVFDNGSNDGSLDLIAAHPLCKLRTVDSGGECDQRVLQTIKGQMWKQSRSSADWVICCDIDELLYHPQILLYLNECKRQGITIPVPNGWQLVSDHFPETDGQIYSEIRTGFPDKSYSKRIIFDPASITDINYYPGCHTANPVGKVREHSDPLLKMLHCKFLGLEYLLRRYEVLAKRKSRYDRERGFGAQYSYSTERITRDMSEWKKRSTIIPLNAEDADNKTVSASFANPFQES